MSLQTSQRTPQAGSIFRPESSKPKPAGQVHTTYVLRSSDGTRPLVVKAPTAMEPATSNLGHGARHHRNGRDSTVAGLPVCRKSRSSGCIPNYNAGSGGPTAAGYGAIALVDAFDNPDAASDLAAFDSYWGLLPAHVREGLCERQRFLHNAYR